MPTQTTNTNTSEFLRAIQRTYHFLIPQLCDLDVQTASALLRRVLASPEGAVEVKVTSEDEEWDQLFEDAARLLAALLEVHDFDGMMLDPEILLTEEEDRIWCQIGAALLAPKV